MNDFSKRYQFEDKITDQEMALRQCQEDLQKKDKQLEKMHEQMQHERKITADKEKENSDKLKEKVQKNERFKVELNDLQL